MQVSMPLIGGGYYDSMLAEVFDDLLAGRCVFIITKFCMRIYPGARLFRGSLVTATPGAGCGRSRNSKRSYE
jgi:hypothetical protein